MGILLAIVLRIVLLFVILHLINMLQASLFELDYPWISGAVSGHALIVLTGGVFLIHTAMKKIYHMIGMDDVEHEVEDAPRRTVAAALFWILTMNLVFSFDTVLSAVALTENFIVMTAAIVVSGLLMVLMADTVASLPREEPHV